MARSRAAAAQAYLDSAGLPRPHVETPHGREAVRRFLLKQAADLDVDSLPVSLRGLLLRPVHPPSLRSRYRDSDLNAGDRQRLLAVLVARGLDARRVAIVLNLIRDKPLDDDDFEGLMAAAVRERERVTRPGENFSVLSVVRYQEEQAKLGYMVEMRTDDGRERVVDLGLTDLRVFTRFREQCIRQAGFIPILKPAYSHAQHRYDYFIELLLKLAEESE